MTITEVRIRMITPHSGKLQAVAAITIDDCFVVHDIKIVDLNGEYFISMPSRKIPSGEFKDIAYPTKSETREMIKKHILDEFYKVKEAQEAGEGE